MKHYGIIGSPLGHSYSEQLFTEKFNKENIDASFEPIELQEAKLPHIRESLHLDGFTVTIPFKELIMKYLDAIDPIAAEIGAVNVVHCEGSFWKGYNTDWIGFRDSIQPLLKETDKKALIFGTGGAAKAVNYALKQLNIQPTMVSRSQGLTYDQLTPEIIGEHTILVNATPLGTAGQYPGQAVNIPYNALTPNHMLFDCVYNPPEPEFLRLGRQMGVERLLNGYPMLVNQARAAWGIWSK